jgi:hypothetical protein
VAAEGIKVHKWGHYVYERKVGNHKVFLNKCRSCSSVPLGKKLLPMQKRPKMKYDFHSIGNNFLPKGTELQLLNIFGKVR